MSERLFPISPRLVDEPHGPFWALRSFPNADRLRPRILAADDDPFSDFDFDFHRLDLSVQAQLGVAGFMDARTDSDVVVRTLDMYRYATGLEVAPGGDGDLIRATRWGAGARVFIRVVTLDASADISSPWGVAASCEQSLAYATYRLETFGVSDPAILAMLPQPGKFGMATVARLYEIMDYIRDVGFAEDKRFAVPFQIRAPANLFQPSVDRAQSTAFAMARVSKGVKLSAALTEAKGDDRISPLVVEQVYAALDAASGPPNAGAKKRAANWLDV